MSPHCMRHTPIPATDPKKLVVDPGRAQRDYRQFHAVAELLCPALTAAAGARWVVGLQVGNG